jgi:pimeloyl-ACP methyl ester carboxylesterase
MQTVFDNWEIVALALGVIWLGIAIWWLVGTIRVRQGFSPFPDIETKTIDADGWTFRYVRAGRGPELILLHGIGANLYCWRWILPHLVKHFTVTALDLPGFGGSSKPLDAAYGLDEQVGRLNGFFKALGIKQMYLMGNSMGGNIGLWYAHLYPDQVIGLGLIAPATSPKLVPLALQRWLWLSGPVSKVLSRPAMRWAHGRTVSKRALIDKDRVEETFRTYGGNHDAVRSFMLATEAIRDPRLGEILNDFAIPVLLLWGSRDKLISRKIIDQLESALRAVESHVHLGGGHHLQEDEPEWVAEKTVSFFLSRPD